MAASAALRRDYGPLEENGIVRSAIFPNKVRDVRVSKGFDTLRALDDTGRVEMTYTRLAKIERGEIFPTGDEMKSISKALGVQVGTLLLDTSDPSFNRESWARGHIEAKLQHRGGGIEAMRLGAAMRVRRLAKGLSTTDMKDPFGLPAATVSRIENAERPIERWDAATQRGIAKVLGVRHASQAAGVVATMLAAGELDAMLAELFSPTAIEERNMRRLKRLLADLPGRKAASMLHQIKLDRSGLVVMSSVAQPDGSFRIEPSDRKILSPEAAGPDAIAIEMAAPVLGPGLPVGTVVVVDPDQAPHDGDVGVILSKSGRSARFVSVVVANGRLVGFSMASNGEVDLAALPKGSVVARMVAAAA